MIPFAVMLLYFLMPGQLHASCGDHVQFANDRVPMEKSHTPSKPCHGPNCSQAPTTPPVVPASVPTQQLEQDPALGLHVSATTGQTWQTIARLEKVSAIHRVYPPEPPPRTLLF
jgi:hypothetical protein